MKIEIKLTLNNLKQNKKRTIFTIISVILCSMLIFVTLLLTSSIKNGITKNIESEYNDYHFIIKDIDTESFNKIKGKSYINTIYVEENNNHKLQRLEKPYAYTSSNNNINVYIKYNDVKKVCDYSNDIIYSLGLLDRADNKCEFNQKLLTAYGLIDVGITYNNDIPICRARINYSYIINIIIGIILGIFSILFIIILYNAFLITINERKKEYAILNSIGTTEGQILKMIFLEGIIIGTIGIIIGGTASIIVTNIILNLLNNILIDAGYTFKLVFDIKYIILSLLIIIFNIYMSSIIPSIKASTTSIIEEIKNNKQIKYEKKKTVLEKIPPVEMEIAIKNIKRSKNKYTSITILLVICMISYITVSTYINYEKESSNLANEYDVDAELRLKQAANLDYKSIFNDYEIKYKEKIEYTQYNEINTFALVEPNDALMTDELVSTFDNNKKSTYITIIGLDDKTYNKYIKKLNANYGDFIIYNNVTKISGNKDLTYSFEPVLKNIDNLKLSIIAIYNDFENDIHTYDIIENLNGNFILTDKLIEGYKEIKKDGKLTIFINMDNYNAIEDTFNNYQDNKKVKQWLYGYENTTFIKIKCKNIIQFSNYLENINKDRNSPIDIEYYTLKNQEKIIYINIVELILKIIMFAIIIIGIVSIINIINASLCERKQEFRILHSLGATKGNINKILIYEDIYMFLKATIISIIISIPILIIIIKYMENIIIFNKLLIPFANITLFFIIILLTLIIITLLSHKSIKQK